MLNSSLYIIPRQVQGDWWVSCSTGYAYVEMLLKLESPSGVGRTSEIDSYLSFLGALTLDFIASQ